MAVGAFVVVLLLIIGLTTSSGGGSTIKHSATTQPHGPGFFAEIRALAGGGSRSFADKQLAAENAAITRTLSYTPFVRIAGSQHRELALTFDDGPGPYTPQLLAVLKREHTPATFFEIGEMEQWFHDSTSEIVHMGDVIGDHTYTHPPMSELSASEQESQLIHQTSAIGQYGAPFPRLFRPPYGLYNSTTLALLRKYKMLMVLWSVDTDDYTLPGVSAIVHTAVSGAKPGAIILMHDAGGNRQETIEALPKVIHDLRARGYKLVTVPQLLLDNPAPRNQSYTSLGGGG
jgi:peptidoglycan/xylan/chitin deacetylase (PgdA/CDA1 family)